MPNFARFCNEYVPGSPAELPNCGAKDAYEHTGDNKETVGRMEEEVKMLREKMESIRGVIYEKDSQITDLSAENVSLNKEIEAIKSKWYDDLADAKNWRKHWRLQYPLQLPKRR